MAERPQAPYLGEVGPPRGCRRSRGCPDAGRAGRCLSARPVRRGDVRPTGRADVQHPGVRCPGVRGIQVSGRTGSGVRGAAAALSAPRWTPEWLSGGPPGRAQRVDVPRSAGGVGACPHRAGREGDVRRLPVPARRRVDRRQGRRLAGVPAAAPPWPRRADTGWSRARMPAGWRGSMGRRRCFTSPPAGRRGGRRRGARPWAWTKRW